ncbi:hypothetical protein DER45DRAFT_124432 [Fusarium avenaceum]|nr:hypothetical protein DER45DRAFT_124432 [Fusarium avenaceum]
MLGSEDSSRIWEGSIWGVWWSLLPGCAQSGGGVTWQEGSVALSPKKKSARLVRPPGTEQSLVFCQLPRYLGTGHHSKYLP